MGVFHPHKSISDADIIINKNVLCTSLSKNNVHFDCWTFDSVSVYTSMAAGMVR